MRVIGHMVTRNEVHRYLPSTLAWLQGLCDEVVVYDDRSDDGTHEFLIDQPEVLSTTRPVDAPSFAEDESRFRSDAWSFMERMVDPKRDDWILAIDADEYLVATHGTEHIRESLRDEMEFWTLMGRSCLWFNVAEVFHLANNEALVRKDGYWGQIVACRAAQWRPRAHFYPRPEGGGSLPSAWIDRGMALTNNEFTILHLGYADAEDRKAKYERYTGSRGHNPQHVQSILHPGRLELWEGVLP